MTETTAGQGLYLFAVTRGLRPGDLAGTPGVDGAPTSLVEHRELQAVVCPVDLSAYGEDALLANLEDMAFLERVARAHNEVVFAAASRATVAPMRLVTICSDEDSVRRRVDALHAELGEALDRVEGCAEWSVKVHAPAAAPAPGAEPEARTSATSPGSGADYLRRKRAAAEQRRSSGEESARRAEEVYGHLAAASRASVTLQPQDPRLTGRQDPMVLNAAFLVPLREGEDFQRAVEEVRTAHPALSVEVEGPWPPYSFATLDAPASAP